jgi:hypothetical protein
VNSVFVNDVSDRGRDFEVNVSAEYGAWFQRVSRKGPRIVKVSSRKFRVCEHKSEAWGFSKRASAYWTGGAGLCPGLDGRDARRHMGIAETIYEVTSSERGSLELHTKTKQQSMGFAEPGALAAAEIAGHGASLVEYFLRPLAGFGNASLRLQEERIVVVGLGYG